jgi:plastocyanin
MRKKKSRSLALLGMTLGLLVAGCGGEQEVVQETHQVPAGNRPVPTIGPADTTTRRAEPATKTAVPDLPIRTAEQARAAMATIPTDTTQLTKVYALDRAPVIAPTLATVDTTITIHANGPELAFDPATITLKQGTRVRLRFVNMGTFAHNIVIVRDDVDLDEIIQRAHDATDNVPMSMKAKMITYSNIAQPTRTVEAAFVVPPPGDYTYVCLVEGHANVMTGRLKSLP